LSECDIFDLTSKGGSFSKMVSDLFKISSILSEIPPVEFVLYLLLRISEISKNSFLPSVK
jgi:hypothetical protein